jgi:replicative DNA helicase
MSTSEKIDQLPENPEAGLPETLRPGGVADQMLLRTKEPRAFSGPARSIKECVEGEVRSIRSRFLEAADSRHPQPATWQDRAWDVLWSRNERTGEDAVFRYSLARRENLKRVSDELEERALKAYYEAPDGYDEVLGDFIPEDFRKAARENLAERAYVAGTNPTAAQDVGAYAARRRARRLSGRRGLATGLAALDGPLGGLRGVTFLGGGPGVGKTSLALALAVGALRADPKLAVLFYSLDMPKDVIYDRVYCRESGVDYTTIVTGEHTTEVGERLHAAYLTLSQHVLPRLRVVEAHNVRDDLRDESNGARPLTWVVFAEHTNRLQQATGAERLLVVVDYFQLLDVPADGSPQDIDFRRVELVQQAQAYTRTGRQPDGDPWLVISEVRKGEAGRASPLTLDDLMGSRRLGYGAEAVLLLDQAVPPVDAAAAVLPVTLRIAKGRDGVTRGDVPLLFEHACCRFREAGGASALGAPAETPPPAKASGRARRRAVDPLAGGRGG